MLRCISPWKCINVVLQVSLKAANKNDATSTLNSCTNIQTNTRLCVTLIDIYHE